MNITILSRNRKLFSIRRLLQEAKKLRVQCDVFDPLDCQIIVSKGISTILHHDRPIVKPDVIIPRIGASLTDYGVSVVRQFESLGVKVMNGSRGIAESRNKLHCLQLLSTKGFDIPTTVLMRGSRGSRMALRYVNGNPVIMKLLQGTQGVGVMLLESIQSVESVLDTMYGLGQDVLLQEFISESAGKDIRAFVIGNEVVASMRRQAKEGEFRSNIHRGGEGVPLELSPQYKRVAVQAAKSLGLTIAGVDILESLSGPKIIEVNSSPGFEGLEAATKLNIARMIIEHAMELGGGKRKASRARKRASPRKSAAKKPAARKTKKK